ncbi:hypothetical protein ABK040_015659 [Willaertia magna]
MNRLIGLSRKNNLSHCCIIPNKSLYCLSSGVRHFSINLKNLQEEKDQDKTKEEKKIDEKADRVAQIEAKLAQKQKLKAQQLLKQTSQPSRKPLLFDNPKEKALVIRGFKLTIAFVIISLFLTAYRVNDTYFKKQIRHFPSPFICLDENSITCVNYFGTSYMHIPKELLSEEEIKAVEEKAIKM